MAVLWWMRAFLATGIAVSLAALTGGAQAREVSVYRGKCGELVLPQGPSGLPAAIRVETLDPREPPSDLAKGQTQRSCAFGAGSNAFHDGETPPAQWLLRIAVVRRLPGDFVQAGWS